jgi:hypothetical protein
MPPNTSDLSVRRHERYLCDIPARLVIEDATVRLSRSILGAESKFAAHVVDMSRGGLGLSSAVYLPPTCSVRIEFSSGDRAVAVTARVQRVAMTDRKPTFYLGGGFDGPDPQRDAVIERVLAELVAAGAKVMPEKARA